GVVAGGVARVLLPAAAADALGAAGAEGPPLGGRAAALPRGRAVAGEQDDADVGGAPGVVEGAVELVDGVRAEGVEDLRPVEGDPHAADVLGPVVGEVGEILEAGYHLPGPRVEGLADVLQCTHVGEPTTPAPRSSSPSTCTQAWAPLG